MVRVTWWVKYECSPCTVELPVVPAVLRPYCSQNNVPTVLFELSFFLGPDLTFSVPSHANSLLCIFSTCFLNQPLSAYDSTAVKISRRAIWGRITFLIKHISHLYVFVLNRSMKVPGP